MTERERIVKELENYEPYAVHFPHITIDGKLILDVLKFLREQPPESESSPKTCSYYEANNKKPCCTHQCIGCVWYV